MGLVSTTDIATTDIIIAVDNLSKWIHESPPRDTGNLDDIKKHVAQTIRQVVVATHANAVDGGSVTDVIEGSIDGYLYR